jgi:hypothetical protein
LPLFLKSNNFFYQTKNLDKMNSQVSFDPSFCSIESFDPFPSNLEEFDPSDDERKYSSRESSGSSSSDNRQLNESNEPRRKRAGADKNKCQRCKDYDELNAKLKEEQVNRAIFDPDIFRCE